MQNLSSNFHLKHWQPNWQENWVCSILWFWLCPNQAKNPQIVATNWKITISFKNLLFLEVLTSPFRVLELHFSPPDQVLEMFWISWSHCPSAGASQYTNITKSDEKFICVKLRGGYDIDLTLEKKKSNKISHFILTSSLMLANMLPYKTLLWTCFSLIQPGEVSPNTILQRKLWHSTYSTMSHAILNFLFRLPKQTIQKSYLWK